MTTYPTPEPPSENAPAQSPHRALGARVFLAVVTVLSRLMRVLARGLPGWSPNP